MAQNTSKEKQETYFLMIFNYVLPTHILHVLPRLRMIIYHPSLAKSWLSFRCIAIIYYYSYIVYIGIFRFSIREFFVKCEIFTLHGWPAFRMANLCDGNPPLFTLSKSIEPTTTATSQRLQPRFRKNSEYQRNNSPPQQAGKLNPRHLLRINIALNPD